MIYGHVGGFLKHDHRQWSDHGKIQQYGALSRDAQSRFHDRGNPPILTNPSFELFSSNLFKNEIISFFLPAVNPCRIPRKVIDDMVWGIFIVTDRNQYSNLKAVVPDSVYSVIPKPRRQGVTVFGIAVDMPLYKDENYIFGYSQRICQYHRPGSGAIIP